MEKLCAEELKPAKDKSIQLGYFGALGVKYHIKIKEQLHEAYATEKKGWLTLWADPHVAFKRKQLQSKTSKNSSTKRAHLDSEGNGLLL